MKLSGFPYLQCLSHWQRFDRFRLSSMLLLGTIAVFFPFLGRTQERLHFISHVEGTVQIRHQWRSDYRRAYPGDTLDPNDLVRVASGGRLTILCDNLSIWQVPRGEFLVSDGCPTQGSWRRSRDLTRSGFDSETPYSIHPPRETAITTEALLRLQWNPIPEATTYRIKIDRYPLADWEMETTDTEIIYSDPLVPNQLFLVEITAYQDDRPIAVSQENTFNVLDRNTQAQVQAEVDRLQAELSLSQEGTVLAIVHLYRRYALYSEAIDILRIWLSTANPNPAMFELLGELYRDVKLYPQAREAYLSAIEFVGDRLALRARTGASLGMVLEQLGENEEAIDWYRQAQSDYQELGNDEKVLELQAAIDRL